jgi:hypothetical protein
MNEERKRILAMLAEGKITADEADGLLEALSKEGGTFTSKEQRSSSSVPPKFLYVKVAGNEDNVDVRIPLGLLRAGMRLTSLIPKVAMDHISQSMKESGVPFDFNNLKPEHIEDLIRELGEMEINVNSKTENQQVKVYCGA